MSVYYFGNVDYDAGSEECCSSTSNNKFFETEEELVKHLVKHHLGDFLTEILEGCPDSDIVDDYNKLCSECVKVGGDSDDDSDDEYEFCWNDYFDLTNYTTEEQLDELLEKISDYEDRFRFVLQKIVFGGQKKRPREGDTGSESPTKATKL